MSQRSSEDRATSLVRRSDAALADLSRSEELWSASIRSSTEEIRLHGLSLDLDNEIRRVKGTFETWASLDPSHVAAVREHGPINLLWVVSAHPSGRVREAFVRESSHLSSDRILPHLANRSIDFVQPIRELATPLVMARLDDVLAAHSQADGPTVLPTSAHIAITKLLAPRTAMMSPELMQLCIDIAVAADLARPRTLRGGGMAKMLDRCAQTLEAAREPSSRKALEALVAYFRQLPI